MNPTGLARNVTKPHPYPSVLSVISVVNVYLCCCNSQRYRRGLS